MYSGLIMVIVSAVTSVVWGIVNIRKQNKKLKDDEKRRFEAYGAYLFKKRDEIARMYENNMKALTAMYPDAATCALYSRNEQRLWNVNSQQSDFLSVRLGTGDIPFQATIEVPKEKFRVDEDQLRDKPEYIKKNYETLYDVPMLIDLKAHPVIGIVGGEDRYGAFEAVRLMVMQLAATHCYTEVKMVFLYNEESSMDCNEWGFVRWLPHVWSQDRKIRYVAASHSEINDVCYELSKIFHERAESSQNSSVNRDDLLPHYVLFISDPSLIEGELIGNYIFRNEGKSGLTTVFLAELYQDLPNACSYIIQNDPVFQGMRNEDGSELAVKFDELTLKRTDEFARRISGIRVKESDLGGELPERLTFLEMYGANTTDDLGSADRWLKNRIYENIRGILGYNGSTTKCILDLHEKYHGPHGLLAGTTGSGKSETLQTYLLSLAVNYSPDDISYFIIDYKGGGMANLFDNLPHLSGQISNLSGAQIHRALVSIKAENRRRQRMFNDAGVNNINKYTKLYKNGEITEPIPHLFIIIDEVAELKREEPEFMRELISVAQVGRSLGVHLILSTQKPSGTVDDNIWSNSKFRICLRVQTKEDSSEMLGKPDAAFITQAGRGYLQVGSDEVYEMFQSGYSGANYDPGSENSSDATVLISRTGQMELAVTRKSEAVSSRDSITQLDAVVAYLADVAGKEGYRKTHQLWMPILRNPMYLEEFDEYNRTGFDFDNGTYRIGCEDIRTAWDLKCVIGQSDDPRNQEQLPLELSFAEGGHHAVIGSVVSGKSTLMATVIYSLATTYSPELFQFYAIDYSSHVLACFENLPHCGGIVFDGEEERLARLMNMLSDMLSERKKMFRGGNYSQYFRANGAKYPAIIVFIDNFGSFNEKTNEKYFPFILQLGKEGVSNGIYLFLSAGGYKSSEIPGRLSENIGTAICLALTDKFAYGDVLRNLKIDVMPEAGFKGRGLAYVGQRILEIQIALAVKADDDYSRMELINTKCSQIAESYVGIRAKSIPEIPEKPTWDIFKDNPQVQEMAESERLIPIGYRSDNALVYPADMFNNYCFMINGSAHSGKKSLMRLMIYAALMKEKSSVVIIDNLNIFSDLENESKVTMIRDGKELYEWCFNKLTPVFKERNLVKRNLIEEGLEGDEYYDGLKDFNSIFIFITSMPFFIKTVYGDEHEMTGFMNTLFKKGEGHKISFIGALDVNSKVEVAGYEVFNSFAAYKKGIHLAGNVAINPWLGFDYLRAAEQMKSYQPGIGQLSAESGGTPDFKLVIPNAKKTKKKHDGN
jgi:S-DNA-T family DNA segregation ATPase FtsK/SpoIIIE